MTSSRHHLATANLVTINDFAGSAEQRPAAVGR
jgi:hypothetical protein